MKSREEIKQRLDEANEKKKFMEMIYLGFLYEFYTPDMEAKIREDSLKLKEQYKTDKDSVDQMLLDQIIKVLEWVLV